MSPRVSVVVPVFNSGPGLDQLVASLVGQTLPPADVEVLLCDDGSEPATRARLDAFEAAHPQIKVLKLAHSGWPGTPRNVGIDTATGKYIFFADHDDRLGIEALKRLCDFADENSSDVVIGKVVGVGRTLPRGMFARTIPDADLVTDPVLDILTPHKLFRLDFLREHGIRFPDGRVRLEDHMLVMKAYFAADVISILADYPCYYWVEREDRPSASRGLIDPESYYPHLATVLDIVLANTSPGDLRENMLERWYRGKVLKRLGGAYLDTYPEGYLERLIDELRPLVKDYFVPGVDKYLTMPMRLRSALLRAERIDGLVALGALETGIKAAAQVTALHWDEQDRLVIDIQAQVKGADGGPPVVPPELAPDLLTAQVRDVSRDLAASGLQLFLRDTSDTATYLQPAAEPDHPDHPGSGAPGVLAPGVLAPGVLVGRAVLDPRHARMGRSVTRRSELLVGISWTGWNFSRFLRIDPELLESFDCERVIGRRRMTVGIAGKNRLILKAAKLPPPPPPPKKPGTPLPPGLKRWARRWVPLGARRVAVRAIRGVTRAARSR